MTSFLDDEVAASKLRQQLRAGYTGELKLLSCLHFFDRFRPSAGAGLEAYLREFIPGMAEYSRECDPAEFLLDDQQSLFHVRDLLQSFSAHVDLKTEQESLAALAAAIGDALYTRPRATAFPVIRNEPRSATVCVTCLFVEDFFYLELPARGRLLTLQVTVESRPSSDDPDEVDLRNPIDSESDPFLEQTRQSVAAARKHLATRFGTPARNRYRVTIAVNHQGARFTGDSLGVAVAVGTIAAISRIETYRDRLGVAPDTAFTGAISPDGRFEAIGSEGLRIKIQRAYFSDLRCLIVPREQISEAWEDLKELERECPDRPCGKLELAGAEDLERVANDPRHLPVERLSIPRYLGQKVQQQARSPWVEVPALVVLLVIAYFLFAPNAWRFWRDHNPSIAVRYVDRISVLSADSLPLYDIRLPGEIDPALWDTVNYRFADLNGDHRNEFVFIPHYRQPFPWADSLQAFGADGKLLFTRDCEIVGQYYGDSVGMFREAVSVWVTPVDGKPVIVTEVFQHAPARQHIKFWSADGKQIGWYINAGATRFELVRDLDGDGRDELIFRGYNNRMHGVTTFVVHPEDSHGASPPYVDSDIDLTWVQHGNQLNYTFFPMTDIAMIDQIKTLDDPGAIEDLGDGTYKTFSIENAGYAYMYYIFGPNLRIRSGFCSDQYAKRHVELTERGFLRPAHSVDACVEHAIDTVCYWSDSGWVTEGELRAAGK